ncbi:unnamed protein product [Closterium sp. NIES-53]
MLQCLELLLQAGESLKHLCEGGGFDRHRFLTCRNRVGLRFSRQIRLTTRSSGPPQSAAPLAALSPYPNCHAALLAAVPPLAARAPPFAACRAALCSPRAVFSSPRAAPAAHSPPLQPASRPCSPRAAFSSPHAAPAARSPPLQPASRPCSPLAARLRPARRPFAARSPPLAARAPPSSIPLAAPCSPRVALLKPARRPLQPARRPLQPARRPLHPCATLLAPPCLRRPACAARSSVRRSAGRPSRAPPCPALRTSLLLARRPALRTSLLLARRPACGRPIRFDTWLDDLQLYLLSDSRDRVSLFDHTSGASLAPPATPDSATRSQWLTRDAAARLAVRNHLPLAERANFCQHKTAKALYDAVVACYSSPATAALACLILPYLFPELSAFATIEDLVIHLRTSDARYRAALQAEFLDRNPPPMYITLYFIVTRLPDSLRAVKDYILALDPTDLTVDLLEKHLLADETSVVTIGATCGTPHTPFFEGCSPSPLAPSYASAAAVDILGAEDVGAASALSGKRRSSKGKGDRSGGRSDGGGGGGGGSEGGGGGGGGDSGGSGGGSGGFGGGCGSSGGGGGGSGGGSGSGGGGTGGSRGGAVQRGGFGGGQRQQEQRRSETPSPQQLREWFAQRGASGGSVRCPYVICMGDPAGQTCGKFHSQHRCFSRLDDAWRAEFGDEAERPRCAELLRSGVDIFALDYDAILAAMYALSVSAEGDCYWCVLPDPGIEAAALGASESALPGTAPAEALHTFTLDSGASRCFFCDSTTLTPLFAPVPVRLADPSGGALLSRSSTVLPCPVYRCPPGYGQYHHSWGSACVNLHVYTDGPLPGHVHPSTSIDSVHTGYRASSLSYVCPGVRVRSSSSPLLVSPPVAPDSPVAPPPWPPLPATPSWHALPPPCFWSSQVSASPPALACPTLPSLRRGAVARRSSLLLVSPDDCSPAASPHGRVGPSPRQWTGLRVLLFAVRLQLRERLRQDLPVLRLQFDRGGEFSDLLRDFCRGEGILQSFTLPASPQRNGIAERRIGLVMETSLTLRWTRKVGDASVIRVWGSCAFVRDLSTDKLSCRATPYILLRFPHHAPGWQFYHPTSRRLLPSQDVTFDKSVPFYRLFPYRTAPLPPPPPLFLAPGPPSVDPLPPQGPSPSGVSLVDPLPGTVPVKVAVDSGTTSGGAEPASAEPGGAESEGAEPGGVELGGAEPGGTEREGAEPEGAESGGAESEGAKPRGTSSAGGPVGASPRLAHALGVELQVSGGSAAGGTRARGAGVTSLGGAGFTAGAGGTGAVGATGPGGARTRGTRAAGAGGVRGAGAGDAGAGGAGAGDPGAGGAGAGGTSAGGAGA